MGIKIKVSEINRLIIYYILIINTCCDINLITCDIHEMRQKQVSEAVTTSDATNENRIDFKINPIELEQHIMSGLNMTKKPDVDMVSSITKTLRLTREQKVPLSEKKDSIDLLQHIQMRMSFLSEQTCLRS